MLNDWPAQKHNAGEEKPVKRVLQTSAVAGLALLAGFVVSWVWASSNNATRINHIVAMSWGDGKYGPGFYGAHVYLEPAANGYSVCARVYIGRGNNYFHDCGELGKVQSDSEAVARWGNIRWHEDGLHIGSETNEYFLARAKLESHR
jgi:hypothetical protein